LTADGGKPVVDRRVCRSSDGDFGVKSDQIAGQKRINPENPPSRIPERPASIRENG